MLVLTRNVGEKIVARTKAGELVVVTIVATRNGRVRVGLEAPQSVEIHREEIARQKDQWAEGLDRMAAMKGEAA